MKDKEKQIEEMAREIAKRDCYLFDNCPKEHKHNCISQDPNIMLESSKKYITIAIWLVELGYRNCKDSVVLSADEFVNLKKYIYEKGSKETAEKILKEVASIIKTQSVNDYNFDDKVIEEPLILNKLEEIAKQFGVKIKE